MAGRIGPRFARLVGPWLGATLLLITGIAHAERRETAATTSADGKVLGIAFVGRMVADLDKSVPFYEAIGLTRDPSVDSSWRRDDALNRLFGIKGALAYMTDPDGLDIELINQRPASPAQNGRPARPAIPPGLSHAGLVILDADKAKAFYGDLLGGQLVETNSPWMHGDFTDSAVGGHGNILRFLNESFAEAADPQTRMHFELVEYQNRKKPVAVYSISDIAVGYVGFEVSGVDALLARVREAGARVVSHGGVVKLDDKTRAVLVRDPDVGGFVELFEPVGRER